MYSCDLLSDKTEITVILPDQRKISIKFNFERTKLEIEALGYFKLPDFKSYPTQKANISVYKYCATQHDNTDTYNLFDQKRKLYYKIISHTMGRKKYNNLDSPEVPPMHEIPPRTPPPSLFLTEDLSEEGNNSPQLHEASESQIRTQPQAQNIEVPVDDTTDPMEIVLNPAHQSIGETYTATQSTPLPVAQVRNELSNQTDEYEQTNEPHSVSSSSSTMLHQGIDANTTDPMEIVLNPAHQSIGETYTATQSTNLGEGSSTQNQTSIEFKGKRYNILNPTLGTSQVLSQYKECLKTNVRGIVNKKKFRLELMKEFVQYNLSTRNDTDKEADYYFKLLVQLCKQILQYNTL